MMHYCNEWHVHLSSENMEKFRMAAMTGEMLMLEAMLWIGFLEFSLNN